MNKTFRIVWSAARAAFIVASECASTHGQGSTNALSIDPARHAFSLRRLALAVCLAAVSLPTLAAPPANTLPTIGQIVGGAAAGSIATNGNAMTVTQSQQRLIANWESFSIGSAASVNFVQPSGGVALNRVTGSQPSDIFGKLNATGSVFLLNPNGVLFGSSAQVNVGVLVATTMDMGDADFLTNRYSFASSSRSSYKASVTNQGAITAAGDGKLGGYIALLAPEVRNEGVISASLGTVLLAGAEAVTLSHDSSGLQYAVDKGAVQALVDNKGLVQVDGGQVILSARAANTLASAVINNSGTIEAKGLVAKGGKIMLEADSITLAAGSTLEASGATGGGQVQVGGDWQGNGMMHQATTVSMEQGAKIVVSATQSGNGGKAVLWSDVNNPNSVTTVAGTITAEGAGNGLGGQVETSGHKLAIADTASVKTGGGLLLLDPYDFTIGTDITGANLGTALGSGNVSIATAAGSASCTGATCGAGNSSGNGDIIFNDAVSWSANTLTLSAYRNIAVNSTVSVSGTGGLTLTTNTGSATGKDAGYLKTAQSGSSFSGKINWTSSGALSMNGSAYTQVTDQAGLAAMSSANKYFLANNIALTGAWTPITGFGGVLDGLGHTLGNLSNGASTSNDQGLFGTISGATIQNLGITSGTLSGYNNVGAFVGRASGGTNTLRNLFTAPASSGTATVTIAPDGTAQRSNIGGILGQLDSGATLYIADSNNGAYINSPVAAANNLTNVGGIVGDSQGTLTIKASANSGTIISGTVANKSTPSSLSDNVGGIVGYINGGTLDVVNTASKADGIANSGDVYGNGYVAGVVGRWNPGSGYIYPYYVTNRGNVSGSYYVGGIAGQAIGPSGSFINYSANLGNITATSGDLVGGLFGYLASTTSGIDISYSYNQGAISGGAGAGGRVGGLVGWAGVVNASIAPQYSYNSGTVTAVNGTYVGGIFGFARVQSGADSSKMIFPQNVYSSGTIIGGTYAGGFAGAVQFDASGTYLATKTYFLQGSANSFYGQTIGGINGGDGLAQTAAYIQDTSNYSNGAFSVIAGVNGGFPVLTNFAPVTPVTISVNAQSMIYGGTAPTGTLSTGNYTLSGCTGCITLDWGRYLTSTTAAGSYGYSTSNLLALNYVSGSASSYSLSWGAGSFTVNPKAVTLTGSKTYDGSTSIAAANLSVASGTVNSDSVTVSGGSGTLASQNAGTRAISSMGSLTLSNANYTLSGGSGSVMVGQKTVGLSATKTYDSNASLTGAVTVTTGVAGEALTYSAATASDAHVATANKYINAITLADGTGGLASNYTLPTLSNANAPVNISARTVTLAGSKTYDGTTSLSGNVTIGNLVSGEDLNYGAVTASDAHVATANKYVNAITLSNGSSGIASDYAAPALSYSAGVNSVTINAKSLTPTLTNSGTTKTYDGGLSTAMTPTYSFTGFVSGDTAATLTNSSKAYDSKDVATASTITVSGLAVSGVTGSNSSAASDYTLSTSSLTTAATITQKTVSLSASKAYDGNVNLGTVTVTTGVTGEALNYSGATAHSKDVGAGDYIDAITLTSSTGNLANYALPSLTAASGNNAVTINAKALTLTGSKTYDGTTSLTGFVTLGGLVSGETLSVTSATANSSHVAANGSNYVSAITLASGTGGGVPGNYSLPAYSYNATNNAVSINAATLTPTITNTGVTKTYDGALTSTFTPTYSFTGLVSGDTAATLTNTGKNYNTKDVTTANQITVSGLAITGITGSNTSATSDYVLDATSKTVSATITAKSLIISGLAASNKTYNALTDVTISNWGSVSTGVGSETLVLNHGTASFADKNVNTGKTVTAIGYSLADGSNGGAASNYSLSSTSSTTTANITAKTITLAGSTGVTKTYNGTTAMPVGSNGYASLVGVEAGDTVTVSGAPVYNSANVNAATTVLIGSTAIAGTDAGNYTLSWTNGSGTITAAPLNIAANNDAKFVTQASTGVAAYSGVSYSGFVNGEGTGVLGLGSLTITRSGTGPDGNTSGVNTLAGTYTNSLTPSGATANNGNYSITYAPGTYTIVPAGQLLVTVNNAAFTYGTAPSYTIASAEYLDGSNVVHTLAAPTASGNTYTYSDGSGGTAVFTLGPQSAQTSTNGALKAGSYSVGASGVTETSNNFSNNLVVVGNLTVNQKGLTATATGLTKVYDGTTAMNNVTLGLTGLEANDVVSISGNGNFATKSVGSGNKSFTIDSLTLGSTDAANYYLSGGSSLTGSTGTITAKAITMSGLSVPSSKIYDATTSAVVSGTPALASFETAGTGTTTDGKAYTGDTVSITGTATGTYNNKNVGTASTVTFGGLSLTGAEAGNYTLTIQSPASAAITAKALTATGLTASSKTYDGNTTATVVGTAALLSAQAPGAGTTSDGKAYTGDTVSITGTAVGTFNSKNVTAANSVAFTGLSLTGGQAGNYTLTAPAADTSARITTKALTVSGITAASKTYDGNTTATVSTSGASYGGLVAGDAVSVSATGTFDTKNVGSGKTVTLASNYSGADVSNYTVTSQSSTTAGITQKALTVSGITAASKTYDGTTAATVSTSGASYSGLVSGDSFTVSATGTFDNKNAGSGKTVTLTSSYSGSDVANYSVTGQSSTTASITQKALSVSGVTASDKVYDGTTTATISTAGASYSGLVSGDSVSVAATGSFSDKNVGNGKTVTLVGVFSGTDQGNYSIASLSPLTASITPKALTVSGITGAGKTYDGNTTATVSISGTNYAGLVSGDAFSVSATGTFDNKNVGSGKTVTLASSYSGSDVGNYSVTGQSTTTASIASKAISMTGATAEDKTFDGTTSAKITLGSLVGLVVGEALTVSGVGRFVSPDVGVGKAVGIQLALADTSSGLAGNYTVSDATAFANINAVPAPLPAPPPSVPTTPPAPTAVPTPRPTVTPPTGGDPAGTGGGDSLTVTLPPGPETPVAAFSGTSSVVVGSSASGGVRVPGSGGFISVRSFGTTTIPADATFSFTLPKDTFKHADPNPTVVLEARQADGKPLPEWLKFNPSTGSFTGHAPKGMKEIELRVTARDSIGGEAVTKLVLRFNAASELR